MKLLLPLVAFLFAACAHSPAFRAELPMQFPMDGKSLAIIGDLQHTNWFVRWVRRREDNRPEQQRLLADLAARRDELSGMVIVGDLVYSARSDGDWAVLDSLIEPFVGELPVLPAVGNHDYPCILVQICRKSRTSRGLKERFPWFEPGVPYAVKADDLLLLFLDSETDLDVQGVWLQDQLQMARGRFAAALVFYHRPAFTNSVDFGAKPNEDVQAHIVPRLEQAAIPIIVFNGHVHGFEYIVRNGIRYVTTAGGGGPRGAMADARPNDQYRGPDCPQPKSGDVFRPFNYALLRREEDRLTVAIRGFCRGDAEIRVLDTIELPL
jgi:hypothetical protein